GKSPVRSRGDLEIAREPEGRVEEVDIRRGRGAAGAARRRLGGERQHERRYVCAIAFQMGRLQPSVRVHRVEPLVGRTAREEAGASPKDSGSVDARMKADADPGRPERVSARRAGVVE